MNKKQKEFLTKLYYDEGQALTANIFYARKKTNIAGEKDKTKVY